MSVIYFWAPDYDIPSGGIRQAYRQVEVMRMLGWDARVVHEDPRFRCSWFKSDVPIMGRNDVVMGSGDVLVLTEVMSWLVPFRGMFDGTIVVYNQNYWLTFKGFGGSEGMMRFYGKCVSHILSNSFYGTEFAKCMFPGKSIHRIRYSFDKPPFGYSPDKEKLICYMPRKRADASENLMLVLNERKSLVGWEIMPIDGDSEEVVAEKLKKCILFLSFAEREGFGMTVCEAMACGCVVVGFSGVGGQEFFGSRFCVEVDDDDLLGFVEAVERMVSRSGDELIWLGRQASDWVRTQYSTEKEVESIRSAWTKILEG